jgi:hypothetical protein
LAVIGCTACDVAPIGTSTGSEATRDSALAIVMSHRPVLQIAAGSGARYTRSHAEGIKDLVALSLVSDVEDLWLYLGDSGWLDVGTAETAGSVRLDEELLSGILSSSIVARPATSVPPISCHTLLA